MTARKIVGGEAGSKVYIDDQGKRYDLSGWVDPSDTLGFGYGKGSHIVYDPAEAMARGLIDQRGQDTGYRPTSKEWRDFDWGRSQSNEDDLAFYSRISNPAIVPTNYKPTLYKDETAVPFPYPEMEDEIMAFRQSRERPGPKGGFSSWGHKVLIPAVMAMLTYGVGSALGGAAGAAGAGASEGAVGGAGAADLAAGTAAGAGGAGIETASLAPSIASAGTSSASALSAPVRNAIINAVLAGGKTGITTGDWRRGLFDAVLSGASSGINYGVGAAGNAIAEGTKGAGQRMAESIVANSINSGMRYGANNLYNSRVRRV